MSGCKHGSAGAELLALVRLAIEKRWHGPESRKLLEGVLPGIARDLVWDFPTLEAADILNEVFVNVNHPNLSAAECPPCWLRSHTKQRLLDTVGRGTSNIVRALLLERLVLTTPGADAFLAQASASGGRACVWGELERLLLQLRWPEDVAAKAVAAMRDKVDCSTGKVSDTAMSGVLNFLTPALRKALVRFVYAKEGFAWAIAEGMDPRRALLQPAACEGLVNIVWKPAALAGTRTLGRPRDEPCEMAG